MTFHSIEPVVPATCGECDDFVAQYGFGNVPCCEGKWPERFFNVSAGIAPPSTCPKRPRTETPLPTSGGGNSDNPWANNPVERCPKCGGTELTLVRDGRTAVCKPCNYRFDRKEALQAQAMSRGARAAMLVMEDADAR